MTEETSPANTLWPCTPYQIEATSVERAAKTAGIPVLRIDTDYSMGDIGQLSTRVEAFLEMIE